MNYSKKFLCFFVYSLIFCSSATLEAFVWTRYDVTLQQQGLSSGLINLLLAQPFSISDEVGPLSNFDNLLALDDTEFGVAMSLLVGLIMAAGVYTAGYINGFWEYESNEKTLARAEHLHAITVDYQPMINMCYSFECYNREDDLYKMAFAISEQDGIDVFISSVQKHIKHLKFVLFLLRDRVQGLGNDKQFVQKKHIVQIMYGAVDQLERDVHSMQKLLTILKRHVVYFKTFERGSYVGNEYIIRA